MGGVFCDDLTSIEFTREEWFEMISFDSIVDFCPVSPSTVQCQSTEWHKQKQGVRLHLNEGIRHFATLRCFFYYYHELSPQIRCFDHHLLRIMLAYSVPKSS